MKLDPRRANTFYTALQAAGMPDVPGEFSVVPQHQVIPAAILAEISDFIRAFDRVTGRMTWQAAALREAPVIAQLRRPEVCFFSAWDFHLPPEGGCRLIEFNDNGSGFLFAAIINALYHEVVGLGQERQIATPAGLPAFEHHMPRWFSRNCISPRPTRWSERCKRSASTPSALYPARSARRSSAITATVSGAR